MTAFVLFRRNTLRRRPSTFGGSSPKFLAACIGDHDGHLLVGSHVPLEEMTVRSALVMAWRFAACPTRRSPSLVNATTEGVVRPPSAFGITTGSPPSIAATTELVVPSQYRLPSHQNPSRYKSRIKLRRNGPRRQPREPWTHLLSISFRCCNVYHAITQTRSPIRYPRCNSSTTVPGSYSSPASTCVTASCTSGLNGWPTLGIASTPICSSTCLN